MAAAGKSIDVACSPHLAGLTQHSVCGVEGAAPFCERFIATRSTRWGAFHSRRADCFRLCRLRFRAGARAGVERGYMFSPGKPAVAKTDERALHISAME
jgi:hypothetical protein